MNVRLHIGLPGGVLFLLVLLAVPAGCGGARTTEPQTLLPPRMRFGTLDSSLYTRRSADINGDGRPDQFAWFDAAGQLALIERDLDFDGRSDMYEYHQNGAVVEQELLLDFDQTIDVVVWWDGGRIMRRDMSTTFDGQFNLTRFYDAEGVLERVERDSNADGRVNVWEFYTGGELVRIGEDLDGDGRPDRLTEVARRNR
jgi:hypothetical protein